MGKLVIVSKKTDARNLKVGDQISFLIDGEPRYRVFGIDKQHVHIEAIKDLSYMRKGEQTKISIEGVAYVYSTKRYKEANYA